MMKKLTLKTASFPKRLAELTHSNQFLKVFSLAALCVSTLGVSAAMVLGAREPIVLALSPAADVLEGSPLPNPEDEVRAAARAYIDRRYRWEPSNVGRRLKEAESFIAPSAFKAYLAATAQVAKFSVEKAVEQRAYPTRIDVNLQRKTIAVFGDRVTSIQGLKAAGDLRFDLEFDIGARTRRNPWGVYITKEVER